MQSLGSWHPELLSCHHYISSLKSYKLHGKDKGEKLTQIKGSGIISLQPTKCAVQTTKAFPHKVLQETDTNVACTNSKH